MKINRLIKKLLAAMELEGNVEVELGVPIDGKPAFHPTINNLRLGKRLITQYQGKKTRIIIVDSATLANFGGKNE